MEINPVNALLVRVDDVKNNEQRVVITTTIDGESKTIIDETADVEELKTETWYFVHPVREAEGNYTVDSDGVWEERGSSENLDDWLLPDKDFMPPQTIQLSGGSSTPFGTQLSNQVNSAGGGRLRFNATGSTVDSIDTKINQSTHMEASTPSADEELGFAVGGEKDFNNVRDNISEGYVPNTAGISPEGLFYDYHFNIPDEDPKKDALFYPSYARAESWNPITKEVEEFLAVGLNSNISLSDFERKPLDIAVVIDVSGSMGSGFNTYHYDKVGRQEEVNEGISKMEAAIDAVKGLTEQLRDNDRLGIVIYNSSARRAKPLRDVENTDMDAIREHLKELNDSGGTDMSAGFDAAVDMLSGVDERNNDTDRESRIVFLTDEMPNRGRTDVYTLVDDFKRAAKKDIHTTFIGVGLDTNPELGDKISEVKGANHYFIHSPDEFRQRLADEFEYMVTPLVYNLRLELEVDGYETIGTYGMPSDTDELLHVSTLFPSPPNEDGETKGSIMLLKLKRKDPDPSITIKASWEQRNGEEKGDVVNPDFDDIEPDYYGNNSVRKAVALARYVDVLRNWAEKEYDGDEEGLTQWEHTSTEVSEPEGSKEDFDLLLKELQEAKNETGDTTLDREIETILEIVE